MAEVTFFPLPPWLWQVLAPPPLVADMTPGPLVLCAGFSVLVIYDMYHSDDLYRSPYRPCGCGMWFLVSYHMGGGHDHGARDQLYIYIYYIILYIYILYIYYLYMNSFTALLTLLLLCAPFPVLLARLKIDSM